MDDLFSDAVGADVEALEQIWRTGKAQPRATSIALAHGLAYDPHIDGKLRLTPLGREKLAATQSPA